MGAKDESRVKELTSRVYARKGRGGETMGGNE